MIKFIFYIIVLNLSIFSESKAFYYTAWQEKYSGQKNSSEAIIVFEKAIQEYPEEAYYYVFLGYSYQKNFEYEKGVKNFERANELKPNDPNIISNLALGYLNTANFFFFEKNQSSQSIVYYEKAIQSNQEASFYNLYGNALRVVGRFEDSFNAFNNSLKLNQKLLEENQGFLNNFYYGVLEGITGFEKLGKLEKAYEFGELGLTYLKDPKEIPEKLVEISIKSNQISKAKSYINRISNLQNMYYYQGLLSLLQNEDLQAERFFKQAIEINPNSYELEQKIFDAYRNKIENLPYNDQISSAYLVKVLKHSKGFMEKYHKANPVKKKLSIISPLQSNFCVFQGEGGKSFHYGKMHYSYDLALCEGDSRGVYVYAVASGTIKAAVSENSDREDGLPVDLKAEPNLIIINHGGGIFSNYYHLKKSSLKVKNGQKVKQGDIIAEIGNSGVTTGPHLHFSLTNKEGLTMPADFNNIVGRPKDSDSSFKKLKKLKEGYEYKNE